MFELEQSISAWRRKMLAAGIKTPVPLDELESHLREEIERQMQLGENAQQAFEVAVARIGRAEVLKAEFAKAKGRLSFSGDNKSTKTDRILGALWLTGCAWSFNTVCHQRISSHPPYVSPDPSLILMNMDAVLIYAAGVIGSVFLFRGAMWGRSIVRMLALLMMVACIAQILNSGMLAGWRVGCGIVAVFSLISIWLLHAPRGANSNPNTAAQ
jgi:hypothetical protein